MKSLFLLALLLALLLATQLSAPLAFAETPMAARQAKPVAVQIDYNRKVALVIGNGKYQSQPLPNPPQDARAMTAALTKLGFETTSLMDADRATMLRGLTEFRQKLRGAGVGLVYFAGHGIQMEGQNYLIPTDADMTQEDSVKYNTVSQQNMLDELDRGGTPIKIIILDACRNNPFERGRGNSGGLAAVSNAAKGTLIAYATSPGRVALDGKVGENGLYTTHLLRALQTPGLGIEEVFKATRVSVAEASKGQQIPWETTSLVGSLTLLPGGASKAQGVTLASAAVVEPGVGTTRSASPVKRLENYAVGTVFRDRDCKECPEMTVVPAGSFMMGSPASESERHPSEGPQKQVTFVKPFAVGRFEVSFDEWQTCLFEGTEPWKDDKTNATPCNHWPSDSGWGREKRPVINVSWEDAQRYVAWLSKKTGRNYRLLSEAEWEYTARAGATTARPWGAALGQNQAYCRDCAPVASSKDKQEVGKGTHVVGTLTANAWNLHDMLGNAWEWTSDCKSPDLSTTPVTGQTSTQGDCSHRAIRGGSWETAAKGVRSAARSFYPVSRRENNIGFRVAADLE